ncbi:hypothetical protein CSV74_07520 [Sporosarcina sp. P19]|uniref:hypothetical protein n=1 Tax=Sporosarcina sp. P19 TaxID=2048258 RepID=UPI000C170B6E|nr:hypothetical protein [Sporosarcina sp. P19]PIC77112.1 hypothetical protein CSV74_07520 [Sporosarcina sp. P19]
MKKVLLTFLLAILVVGGTTLTADAAGVAEKGIYTITSGEEAYYSTKDFKGFAKAKKIDIFKSESFIVLGTSVYPITALIMSNAAIAQSVTPLATFEKDHNVDFSDIANGTVNESFEVVSID